MLKSGIVNEYLSLILVNASNELTDYVVVKIGKKISKNDVKILKGEKITHFTEFFNSIAINLEHLEEFALENDLDIKFYKKRNFSRKFYGVDKRSAKYARIYTFSYKLKSLMPKQEKSKEEIEKELNEEYIRKQIINKYIRSEMIKSAKKGCKSITFKVGECLDDSITTTLGDYRKFARDNNLSIYCYDSSGNNEDNHDFNIFEVKEVTIYLRNDLFV